MKKIIKLIVEIDSDNEFNLDELAVGKYTETESDNEQHLVISEGEVDKDKFFRVKDYLKVEDITEQYKELKQQLIGVEFMNNRFTTDIHFEEEYNTLHEDDQKLIDEEIKNNL